MRAGDQQRRAVARRMDRRHHRDVDVARAFADERGGLLLAAGRDRIDVEVIGIAGKMRRDRTRGLQAGGGGDRRDDHIGFRDRVGRRGREPHAGFFAGRLERRAFGLRKQDVPGGDALDAGLAQAGGDRLPGLAEADEGNARGVAAGHDLCGSCTILSGTPGTGGVPLVWNERMVCRPQAWPFLRSASLQVIGFQSGASTSRAPAQDDFDAVAARLVHVKKEGLLDGVLVRAGLDDRRRSPGTRRRRAARPRANRARR